MTRQRLILAGAVLLALVGSFGVGRYSRAPVYKDVYRTQIEYKDRVVTQVVHDVQTVHDVETKLRTVTKWQTMPGGVTTVVQEVARDTQAETKRADHVDAKQDRETQQTSVTVHTVDARPNWSVSLLPGVDLTGRSSLPYHGVIGGSVDYRIIGNAHVGGWVMSPRAFGAIIRGDF